MDKLLCIFSMVMIVLPVAAEGAVPVTDGLIVHLDAGSLAGLSNGDNVTSWADSATSDSVNGTVSQVTIDDPEYGGVVTYGVPTFVSSAVNGLPAVRFTRPTDPVAAPASVSYTHLTLPTN